LPPAQKPEGERIAKVIARAGICSRRDAEKLILEGRVKLDGVLVTSPAINVTENNVVQVDEKPLAQPEAARMWRYHKPSGLVTTHKDEKGRPTVFGNLPKHLGRVVSVGRLDFNSEGLLLLTNDGDIARRMEIPASGWTRIYRARLFGKVTQADLDKLATGITIDGVKYGPIVADLERSKGMYSWATVKLKEGKNREVKRLMERLGLKISDFDLIELNEAFASQGIACLRQLGVKDDADFVNPHGGAIALGHPLGMSGARLALTAVHGLEKRGGKRALATMCVGVGQGVAMAIEKLN